LGEGEDEEYDRSGQGDGPGDERKGRAEEDGAKDRRHGAEDKVRLIQCDGLSGVSPDEVTHIAITGMGGDLISTILAAAPWTADGRHTLILQAETAARRLRAFLYTHGYNIRDEVAVVANRRVYTVMCVIGGGEAPADSFFTRVSLPLSRRNDDAALLYFAKVRRSVQREMRGMNVDSAEYVEAAEHLRRLEQLEGLTNA
jgi:tRNA (adenine22-N1)-methyltransferase